MACDMCGAAGRMYITTVEETEMTVCESCKTYGTVKRAIPTAKEQAVQEKRQKQFVQARAHQKQVERDTTEIIVADYAQRIKRARENLGKKQEKFAQEMGLKASQLHSFESGHREPSLETARKLEKALHITLTETYVEEHKKTLASHDGPLTIADLLKK